MEHDAFRLQGRMGALVVCQGSDRDRYCDPRYGRELRLQRAYARVSDR